MKKILFSLLFLGILIVGCVSPNQNKAIGCWVIGGYGKLEINPDNTFAVYGINPNTGQQFVMIRGNWADNNNSTLLLSYQSGYSVQNETIIYNSQTDSITENSLYNTTMTLYRC